MARAAHNPLRKSILFTGRGITSRQDISVEIKQKEPGHGIIFEIADKGKYTSIPALSEYVVNTLRNVVLGNQGKRLCIVEHFLAAASLWGLNDLLITVDGPEMPLGDGSCQFWIDLFTKAGWEQQTITAIVEMSKPIICTKGDRLLMAIPDTHFSMSYHMDWPHPLIGKRWQTWDATMDYAKISRARTFGSMAEHKLLGLENEVVSLTEDGFSQPLRFEDEPVRHKLLDLIGDLALTGINPMAFKARFVSIKGGHELDIELTRFLRGLVINPKSL